MAAADYYNPGGGGNPPQAVPQYAPQRPQQPPQQNLNPLPYPVSDEPPPYSTLASARPHSQPPAHRPPMYTPQGSGYHSSNLNSSQLNVNTHQYPPEKQVHFARPQQQQQQQQQNSGTYGNLHPQYAQQPYRGAQPQTQSGFPFPNGQAPAPTQVYGRRPSGTFRHQSTTSIPYYKDDDSRSPSRSRSRERGQHHRNHHHHHHHPTRPQPKKKASGASTFLGAGGGAIIGDAIFPGLGTLGGAILGGLGGHEYGKQRRSYSNDRDYYEANVRRGRRY
ncbi:hypothetical protein Tdes44962_MAKER05142 [Teratosphaeria destructans]|uniref:Uncharacterized protein n=1 Tax=Teratosphaeria destructans TaxID=418781 RepID=A0A9W7VZA5_9PEZI|nr:hypothetical protein Tdes44962_MAKER05142 [Teratosphaeria destructans]